MLLLKAFERFNLSSSLSRKRPLEINRRRRRRGLFDTMHAKPDVLFECMILFIFYGGGVGGGGVVDGGGGDDVNESVNLYMYRSLRRRA